MTALRYPLLLVLILLLSACAQLPSPEASILHTRLSAAVHRFRASVPGDEYVWHFGDGKTAEGREVEHTFAKRGTYTVNLNVYHGVEARHAVLVVDVGTDWVVDGREDTRSVHDRSLNVAQLESVLDKAEDGDTLRVSGVFGELVLEEREIEIVGDATFIRIIYRGVGGLLSGVTLIGTQDAEREEPRPALILEHANPRIVGCTIRGSRVDGYGGGIYAIESNAWFIDCEISDNRAVHGGGGAYVSGSMAFPRFLNCTFRDNRADAGGAAILMKTVLDQPLPPEVPPLHVEGCTFVGNRAQATFAGSPVVGGAIHIGFGGRASIVNCTYAENWPADVVFEDTYRQP